jgi:uncharacterized membrane protein
MPFWCGGWGTGSGLWWIFPLIGLAVMVAMAFVCVRGAGCFGRRAGGDVGELRREVSELKEDVRKLLRGAS